MHPTEYLLSWYEKNKRPLPWRQTRDPYRIWLSEVILQQTRVNQGMDYYHRFVSAFPDVQSLAAAPEQDVLKLWQGLGYYSRARNLHHAAKEIVKNHKGIFPKTSAGLKKLKGVGDYTAAAIASICFDEPVAVLDGNVARVLARVYAVEAAVDTASGRALLIGLATQMLQHYHPGTFNQAMMELGALVCTPQNPDCMACPLSATCSAFAGNKVLKFPVKIPKKAPKIRYLNYLVISFVKENETFFVMRKRQGKDIWKNMYDFPCIETETETAADAVLKAGEAQGVLPAGNYMVNNVSGQYIHQLTHQKLLASFIRIHLHHTLKAGFAGQAVPRQRITDLPLPRLIEKYLEVVL